MRKFLFLALALVSVFGLVGSKAVANPVNSGDIIKVYDVSPGTLAGVYKIVDLTNGNVPYTFCLEHNEYFATGAQLKVDDVSGDVIQRGGLGTIALPTPLPGFLFSGARAH